MGFDVVPQNEEINFLIQLYDDRRDKNTLFSAVGTYFDNNIVKNNVLYALFLQLNVDLKKSFPFDLDLQSSNLFKPNYIPFIISLDKYYEYINLFNVEFKNKFGFSTKDFVVFISALTLHALYSFEKYHCYRYALLQRAYTVYDDKNALLDGICEIATSLYSKKFGYLPKDLNLYINKIFKYLTCERNAPRDISLWTRGPRKIFYPIDNNRGIIDYSGMLSVLETLMLPLSRLDGEAGNKRSIHFENETNDLVKKTFGLDCYWIGQKKINNGKGEEREIDSSFFIREFLFLLECKSVNVSFAFDMGDKRALEFRKEKIKRAFDELNDKVDFIVKNRKCLSYPIPQNIKYIIPIVVSPFAEYIWEKSDNLFISENLPRVLTPNELGEIKEFKDLSFLINKPFTTILPD
ncbi:MAG TPA: hypothetical protein ENG48_05075 [Candidatus Atribacteria bacterium]|nr:hypothetical protein [Candidatus Atribacteria bacterium]